jgi:hypothetical protein
MDRYDVLANCALLLFAGHETTMNLIGNGILAFIRNPDQWNTLRTNPEGLARRATEECLRFDPPVKSTQRIAGADVTLGTRTSVRAPPRDARACLSAERAVPLAPGAAGAVAMSGGTPTGARARGSRPLRRTRRLPPHRADGRSGERPLARVTSWTAIPKATHALWRLPRTVRWPHV